MVNSVLIVDMLLSPGTTNLKKPAYGLVFCFLRAGLLIELSAIIRLNYFPFSSLPDEPRKAQKRYTSFVSTPAGTMMTTPSLTRDWRLPTAGLIALIVLFTGLTLHAHWGAFIQWCLASQITLHRYLVMYLLQLNNHQYSGGLWLLTGSFFYGVLHAIGPGHGKFIVTTYLSTNKESQVAARVVPFMGSLMQGVSAILFVFILAVGFNLASGDLSTSRWYVEKISALLIGAFGAFIIYQAFKSLRPRTMAISAISPLHQHDAQCGCGHHGVGADMAQGDWKTRLGVILAIGARPCSGAIMILLFSNALGIVSWGIAAVMTMSLGTALSIMGLSLAVRYARERTVALFGGSSSMRWLVPTAKIAGGVVLILFAAVLFLTTIPISADGDFIAAGC